MAWRRLVELHYELLSCSVGGQQLEIRRGSRLIPFAPQLAWSYETKRSVDLQHPSGATVKHDEEIKNAAIGRAQCRP